MSQQKQQSWEPPSAPKYSPSQCPNISLAACDLCSGGRDSGSLKPGGKSPGHSQRAHCKKPRCLGGGTVYHIKEKECWGDQVQLLSPVQVSALRWLGSSGSPPLAWAGKYFLAPISCTPASVLFPFSSTTLCSQSYGCYKPWGPRRDWGLHRWILPLFPPKMLTGGVSETHSLRFLSQHPHSHQPMSWCNPHTERFCVTNMLSTYCVLCSVFPDVIGGLSLF